MHLPNSQWPHIANTSVAEMGLGDTFLAATCNSVLEAYGGMMTDVSDMDSFGSWGVKLTKLPRWA
jgi:hypothetical protein